MINESPKVVVLRWGHRPRDYRLTTHVALTARAFHASGIIVADVNDESIKRTINKVVYNWGGKFFFEMGVPWKTVIRKWRKKNDIVVHLTAYGENIQTSDVLQRIKASKGNLLVIVGGRKVPKEFFSPEISHFNVAIGNQPHSECSSLAVFLDRFFEGRELKTKFKGGRLRITQPKSEKRAFIRKI